MDGRLLCCDPSIWYAMRTLNLHGVDALLRFVAVSLPTSCIDGLVQDCGNSNTLAMEKLQSYTEPLIWLLCWNGDNRMIASMPYICDVIHVNRLIMYHLIKQSEGQKTRIYFLFHTVFFFEDPILISGTLRTNLDPLRQHYDDDLWVVLEHAHLKKYIMGLEGGLGHVCEENGSNLR